MQGRTIRFAEIGSALALATRRAGHTAPRFRSPPRTAGRDRSIRRRRDGSSTVAVRLDGRPMAAVVADMIEGTVAANRLEGPAAEELRRDLWSVAEAAGGDLLAAA